MVLFVFVPFLGYFNIWCTRMAIRRRLDYRKFAGIVVVSIILAFLLPFVSEGAYEEHKLKEIKKEINIEKEKLRLTKKKEQETLSNLYLINKKLNQALDDLNYANYKISENKKRVRELNIGLADAEEKLGLKAEELKSKIVEAYKSGRSNYLEILFASRTMADFINRSYYFERAISADIDLIKEIKSLIAQSKRTRTELLARTSEIKRYSSVVEKKKKEMSLQANRKRKAYESLKSRRREYERRIAEMEKSSRELETLINRTVSKSKTQPKSTGKMAWPAKGRLVSRFGYRRHPLWGGTHFHTGLDIAAPYGTPVRAADSGDVIFAGWWDGFGKSVVINHGKSITTVYGHMSRLYVRSGQVIGKGQVVGLIGSTGYSTGPHLHFEVRVRGKPVNPMSRL